MIFHSPKDWSSLSSMTKRAIHFQKAGKIDSKHRLAPTWSNTLMMLQADKTGEPIESVGPYEEIDSVDQYILDLNILDWFATKVDHYAKTNMLEGDESFAEISRQWLEILPCVPLPLVADKRMMGYFNKH